MERFYAQKTKNLQKSQIFSQDRDVDNMIKQYDTESQNDFQKSSSF